MHPSELASIPLGLEGRNRQNQPDKPLVRVLVTAPAMRRPGGVAQCLHTLRPHLGEHVHYFTVGSRRGGEALNTVVRRFCQDCWRFAALLRHGGYSAVHLNPSMLFKALLRDGMLLVIAKVFRRPVIVFVHGWNEECERLVSTWMPWLFRLVYGRANAFILLGDRFKAKLRRLGYPGPAFILGLPVEEELMDDCRRPSARSESPMREEFNVLFLARIEREKGIYETLEAYRILKQHHPCASLTVAGNGPELDPATRYASRAGLRDVSFLGHIEGPAKHQAYIRADAYLLPSYTEGLPLTVLEAITCGLPVVTTAVGGLPDLVQDGRMGFVTESRNPEVLASLLTRLITDPELCARIRQFNREYARNSFFAPELAARLEQIYEFVSQDAH